jgi:hypothetical protein
MRKASRDPKQESVQFCAEEKREKEIGEAVGLVQANIAGTVRKSEFSNPEGRTAPGMNRHYSQSHPDHKPPSEEQRQAHWL